MTFNIFNTNEWQPLNHYIRVNGAWQAVASAHEKSPNLWDGQYKKGYIDANGVYKSPDDTTLMIVVECKPNAEYTIKQQTTTIGSSHRWRIALFDDLPINNKQGTLVIDDNTLYESTITTRTDSKYIAVYYVYSSSPEEVDFMVNEGNASLPYEPYWN